GSRTHPGDQPVALGLGLGAPLGAHRVEVLISNGDKHGEIRRRKKRLHFVERHERETVTSRVMNIRLVACEPGNREIRAVAERGVDDIRDLACSEYDDPSHGGHTILCPQHTAASECDRDRTWAVEAPRSYGTLVLAAIVSRGTIAYRNGKAAG